MPMNCNPEPRGKGGYGGLDAAGDGEGAFATCVDPGVDADDEVVLRREDGRPELLVEQDEGCAGHSADRSILGSALAADPCVPHGPSLYITPFSYSILVPPSSILVLFTISGQLALVFSGFE